MREILEREMERRHEKFGNVAASGWWEVNNVFEFIFASTRQSVI